MDSISKNEQALHFQLYQMAHFIRRSQDLLMEEYHPADEMRCPIHFCVGQEASPAALSLLLRDDDVVFSHHRSHGYYLAKGAPLDDMVAEFYGKATGSNGGLAGSMELSHEDHNFFSGTIMSGPVALAAGGAFARKYTGSDAVAIGILGDGGMEEGIVYETMNLAAVKNLPLLFLCENNGYSIHSPLNERSVSSSLADRADVFGIRSERLDGNDAVQLYARFSDILAKIRAGEGPYFVEVETYRYCGHVGPEGDDHYNYRPHAEMVKWEQRDPVKLLRELLEDDKTTAAELDRIDQENDAKVLTAIENAKNAPFPDFETSISYNLSVGYSPIVTQLIDGAVSDFDFAQQETMPEPY